MLLLIINLKSFQSWLSFLHELRNDINLKKLSDADTSEKQDNLKSWKMKQKNKDRKKKN